MSTKALCIHAHFYQPPREDPITGIIPQEPGATPHKNWNEKIHAECYRPNAKLGNFKRLSFNVGPTLSTWMARHHPTTYRQIIDQDRVNVTHFGVGNAIAQAYHHTILPLATTTDKIIQVAWGIADFEHRFGRKPQGMWLPETGVDYETLEILADHGIEFTILAPWQAESETPDTTEPYLVSLPGRKTISVFFYQRDLSARVSFDPQSTANAERFATQDLSLFFYPEKEQRGESQLLLLASDGELYGHHQPHRDRFLAHLLNGASARAGILTVYPALWLKNNSPRKIIKIRENTSWSCHHGITRWMGDCSCSQSGGSWKTPLRRSLDRLARSLDWLFYDQIYPYIPKPRFLLQRYIYVLLGDLTVGQLIREMSVRQLTSDQTSRIRLLLEAQVERQRMFASCGWFYDDFDRIEPKNNLAYAAQAVRLVRIATGEDLAPQMLTDLMQVFDSHTGLRGDSVFEDHLQRSMAIRGKSPKG